MKRTIISILSVLVLLSMFLTAIPAAAATITTAGSGNWNSTTNNAPWPGGTVPLSTDDVVIRAGDSVTVTANATINSIAFNNNSTSTATLTVSTGVTLTVTTGITLRNAAGANTAATIAGAGTINCASVTVGGTTTNLSGDATTTLTSTISTLSISGNLNINGEDDSYDDNNATFALASGTVSVGGTINTDEESDSTVTLTLNTGAETGTLILTGSTPFTDVNGSPTFDANGTSATVVYSGAAQTVRAVTYRNLTLSGSGTKTMTGVSTVNGNLTLSGTASATLAADLTIGGNLTVGTGTTLNLSTFTANRNPAGGTFTLQNTATLLVGGASNFPGNYSTYNLGTTSTVNYNRTGAQTISAQTYGNLTTSGSGTKTLGGNVTVNNVLTLTNGIITTNANKVIISNTASPISGGSSASYVNGNLQMYVAYDNVVVDFKVGTASGYNPVSVHFDDVSDDGNLTAKATAGEHPNIGSSTIDSSKDVNVYWSFTNDGIALEPGSNYSAIFNFNSGDKDGGANTANFIVGKYSAGWTYPTVGTKLSTSTQATGMTFFSDFAVGEQQITHTITVTQGANGTITPAGPTVTVGEGNDQTFTIAPNTSYIVFDVLVDGGSQGRVNSYTFTNVTADHTITASFEDSWKQPDSFDAIGGDINNDDYAYTSNNQWTEYDSNSDINSYSGFGFAIPDGATIDGIQVAIEGKKDSGETRTWDVSLWNGSGWTTSQNTGTLPQTYDTTLILGTSTDKWGFGSWTPAIINNTNFAVRMDATSGSGNSIWLDQVQVKVYYTVTHPPTVALTPYIPDPTNDNTPSYSGTATDTTDNVVDIEFRVDGGSWTDVVSFTPSTSVPFTFTTGTLTNGSHTIGVRAQDAALSWSSIVTDNLTIDTTSPTVTINQAASQYDPTSTSPINFTVVFSESVSGFATGDVSLSGTAGATTATVSGTGPTYNVAVTGMTGSGTVIATILAGKAQDAAGNLNTASTSGDNQVIYVVPATNPALAASCGLDIVLIMDESESISSSEFNQMKTAFVNFVNALLTETDTEFALVDFGTNPVLRVSFTGVAAAIIDAPNGINGSKLDGPSQYTNWEQALFTAHGLFPYPDKPDLIIIFTDGDPTAYGSGGPGDPLVTGTDAATEAAALARAIVEANDIKGDGIRIVTFGIGSPNAAQIVNLTAISSADAVYTSNFIQLATDLNQADADGDGYGAACECDDTNAAINPGATEVCNDIDDNCNGQVDEGVLCDDGDPCTTGDVCTNGVCAGTPISCATCLKCEGGNCVPDPTQTGTTCNDGDPCTENDVCDGNGNCAGTPIPNCRCPECTTPVSVTIVSDDSATTTYVTQWNTADATSFVARLAWVHPKWTTDLTGYTFPTAAKWIWENDHPVHPILGDVVTFENTVNIPAGATNIVGTIHITCDNGYEVWLDGSTLVGSAQVHDGIGDWQVSDLTAAYVDSSGWQSVEFFNISGLHVGDNIFTFECANEYMGPPEQSNGNPDSNPAGLIFEIEISYCVPVECPTCQHCVADECVDICSGTVGSCGCTECLNCDDSNPCTTDSCVAGQCVHTPVDSLCSTDGWVDTNPLVTQWVDIDGVPCQEKEQKEQVWRDHFCDETLGCQYTDTTTTQWVDTGSTQNKPNGTPCPDDGVACTIDSCDNGQCVNTPMDCDDGNPCTTDSCVAGVCVNTNVCTADAGLGQSIPLGGSVVIGGNPTGSCSPNCTYLWSPATGLNDATLANPTASPTSTTLYTVTVTPTGSTVCFPTASMTVTVTPPPRTGGGAAPEKCYLVIDMLGERTMVEMNCCRNTTAEECQAYDEEEVHLLAFPEGTLVRCGDCEDCNCYPRIIVMSQSDESITPPEGMTLVGPIYDFTGYKDTLRHLACSLATYFDPSASVLLHYDPALLPEGASNPVIAFFSHTDNQWVILPPDTGIVAEVGVATGLADYFASPFAVLASVTPPATPTPPPPAPTPAHFVASGLSIAPAEIKAGESVTISLNVANDGEQAGTYLVELKINGNTIDSKVLTLDGGQSEPVSFAVSAAEAGTYEATVSGLSGSFTVETTSNWWIYLIIAAVVILAGVLVLLIRRRA